MDQTRVPRLLAKLIPLFLPHSESQMFAPSQRGGFVIFAFAFVTSPPQPRPEIGGNQLGSPNDNHLSRPAILTVVIAADLLSWYAVMQTQSTPLAVGYGFLAITLAAVAVRRLFVEEATSIMNNQTIVSVARWTAPPLVPCSCPCSPPSRLATAFSTRCVDRSGKHDRHCPIVYDLRANRCLEMGKDRRFVDSWRICPVRCRKPRHAAQNRLRAMSRHGPALFGMLVATVKAPPPSFREESRPVGFVARWGIRFTLILSFLTFLLCVVGLSIFWFWASHQNTSGLGGLGVALVMFHVGVVDMFITSAGCLLAAIGLGIEAFARRRLGRVLTLLLALNAATGPIRCCSSMLWNIASGIHYWFARSTAGMSSGLNLYYPHAQSRRRLTEKVIWHCALLSKRPALT